MSHADMTMEERIRKSHEVVAEAYERFPIENMRVAFTGGKDSTLLTWLVHTYAQKAGKPTPRLMFINEGSIFDEIHEFKNRLAHEWGLTLDEVQNDNVIAVSGGVIGRPVRVADLDDGNRQEVARLGYMEETFPFEPESYVGNHLMKTVAMNRYLAHEQVAAVFVGIRHDEQSARANETYFSPRQEPAHTRVHPLLHYRESDVWDTIRSKGIPFVTLYEQGYRSLGAKHSTGKTTDVPAWEQDLENTTERQGRRQDKEGIMERLRELGYM